MALDKNNKATWPALTIFMSTSAFGALFLGGQFGHLDMSLNGEPSNFMPSRAHGLSFCKPNTPAPSVPAGGSCHQLPQAPPKAEFPPRARSVLAL